MQQIAVRAVNLNGIDAEPRRSPCRIRERIAHARDALGVERRWRMPAVIIWNVGRRYGLPAFRMIWCEMFSPLPRHFARRFASGVRELNRDRHRGPATHTLDDTADCLLGLVGPETDVGVSDAAFGNNRGGFNREKRRTR